MTLFFQSNNISKEWERIKIALGKSKEERTTRPNEGQILRSGSFYPFKRNGKRPVENLTY